MSICSDSFSLNYFLTGWETIDVFVGISEPKRDLVKVLLRDEIEVSISMSSMLSKVVS